MASLSRDMQRKRMEKHREILAITDRVLPDSEISYEDIFDAFHTPYSKVAGDYLKLRGGLIDVRRTQDSSSNQALDCFSRLPLEIFELIFTNLSFWALDAARFTCRALYTRIMTSSHVLEAVVDLDKPTQRCSTDNRLRDLGRNLDRDADLVRNPVEPQGWRVRYRHCGIDFCCLQSNDTSLQKTPMMPALIVNARFCIDSTSVAALITKPQGPDWTSKIFLYQFCISGRPRYIGSIPLHHNEDSVFIRSAAILDRSEAWSISVEVGKNIDQYRVESSKAFSIDTPTFTIKPEHSLSQTGGKTPPTSESDDKNCDKNWVVLGRLPKRDYPQADATGSSPRRSKLFHLARHVESGQLYTALVRRFSSFAETLRSPSLSWRIKTLVPIAKLQSPHNHAIYQNVAISPLLAVDDTIQIAIIWQIPTPLSHTSELYIYEIPTLYQQFNSEIQAKRVRSLGVGIGGIHPSSTLFKRPDPLSPELPSNIDDQQNALSGLAFLQTAQKGSLNFYIPKQRVYIYAWGPCNNGIKLHIFDISYSTPFLNTLPPHPASGSKFVRKIDPSYNWSNVCQCALHDDGYRVVLLRLWPSYMGRNTGATAEVEGKTSTSRWLRIFTRKKNAEEGEEEEDLGSVEWRVEAPVQQALNRKEEWLLEKVRVLKRAGLDDEGVVAAWFSRRWTGFGLTPLPAGWKDLGF